MPAEVNRQWLLARRPTGEPELEDFEFREASIPAPGPNEVLVRTIYLSVDPYMRGRMRDAESYTEPWAVGQVMRANVVGQVVESNSHEYTAGEIVTGDLEWADYAVVPGHELTPVDPELGPISTALGVLGTTGRTAYFGMLDVGEPRPGETVVVSGGAGAVGSVAGQIARLAGCRVVGIAGSDRKTEWLTEELGFDAAINYQTTEVEQALAEACPDGVDVYYDNVGGEITDAVLEHLALNAQVVVCGQIALYNEEETPTGPRHLHKLIRKRASIEGFLIYDYRHRQAEANEQLAEWLAAGDLDHEETITHGLENAVEAFLGLFDGENIGKQLVQVTEPPTNF